MRFLEDEYKKKNIIIVWKRTQEMRTTLKTLKSPLKDAMKMGMSVTGTDNVLAL